MKISTQSFSPRPHDAQSHLAADAYNKRILAVEDDGELQQFLSEILHREGYTSVRVVGSVSQALALEQIWNPEVFLLDVMLPDGDGFELLQEIRTHNQAPALFLSARDEDEARLTGLGLGADDYITKPFLPQELMLRLKAVITRTYGFYGQPSTAADEYTVKNRYDVLELGNITVNFSIGVVECEGKSVPLTSTEVAILNVLRHNRGIIVTMDTLMEEVWGSSFGYENSLMVHMHRLRDKIEEDPKNPRWLVTARGLGYRLAAQ